MVAADGFGAKFDASVKTLQPYLDLPFQETKHESNQKHSENESNFMNRHSFRVIYKAANIFDTLQWMFDERQDILATFVRQIAEPVEASQPGITRIRARRK